ncbi:MULTISPECIES: hypothetical protein [Methanocorpusculum]|jgi:hypothetical protein|uniref:Transglutaminase-like domain-containing protein n=1 Tax=Methanocorpusculum parvum TaxID=2193 RepID=A0AAX0Q6S3_9EURY|nr:MULTISPECIES: hypothetical protein [Methanocorpusculum]MDY3202121.1 hypothetical protein [Methanocorpusculum sp.]MEA5085945.1 hypothetical protein [Methanocorpusculum sp.]PAV08970.1 hypothetical protein ASJ83_01325 [Methanocorpusculum parvum]HJJ34265.1 hypothetical protein [Methanocorpusculum sp.]HJJ37105.1 hypothetical protein [Methanocorpusculum sp.]
MAKRGLKKCVVYPQIVPTDESDTISAQITFPYRHLNYSFTIEIPLSLYKGAKRSGKSAKVPAGIQDAWLAGYYAAFTLDPCLNRVYQTLLSKFRKIRNERNLNDDEYLELLTAYVQSLPYDTEKLSSIDPAPRFPVETIVDGTGICSDKSLLLAGLLSHEGYAVSVLQFAKENHLTVGLPAPPGYDFAGCGHAVVETTAISYIGHPAGEYADTTSRPKVFPIGHGTKRYGSIRDVAKILEMLDSLNEKISENGTLTLEIVRLHEKLLDLKDELTRSSDELLVLSAEEKIQEYEALRHRHNANVARLKKMIDSYNRLVGEYQKLAGLAEFIKHNRLDRPAVSRKLNSAVD